MSRPLSPEDVFRLHQSIRWTAYSTGSGAVVFCQMRTGVKSHTSEAEDRAFMEFGPHLLSGIAERLSPAGGAGRVVSLIVNFEKDSVLLTKVRDGYLAISVDRPAAPSVFQEVETSIRELQ